MLLLPPLFLLSIESLYRIWVGLTEFDSTIQLHMVHYIIHSSCFFCALWFTEPSPQLPKSCVTCLEVVNVSIYLLIYH
jgi:hypothetical protein